MSHLATADRKRTRVWPLAVALLTTIALVSGAASCDRHVAERAQGASPRAPATARAADDRPTRLTIPRIDVRTSVVSLGLNADQTVEVPADPTKAGWYRYGSVPGRSGSTVILGHVDSDSGPAVFYRLRSLARGDLIYVRLSDGTRVRFAVDSVATYPNDEFPATKVYRADGPSRLVLVTCGGNYDASRGGYQANVVVSARASG